jgi:hypothetical protein
VVRPAKWFKIRLWNFVGLAFQTSPFQCLRIARAAENHFLVPNQNHDVANFGRCMASDENLRGSELLSHLPTPSATTAQSGLRHVASGGSISGASGVISSGAPGSSTFDLRSAALSIRAAEILGSLVALAIPNRIKA